MQWARHNVGQQCVDGTVRLGGYRVARQRNEGHVSRLPEVGDAQGQGRVRGDVLANEDVTKEPERAIRGRDGVRLWRSHWAPKVERNRVHGPREGQWLNIVVSLPFSTATKE